MAIRAHKKSTIKHFMRLAFEQAKINLGSTGVNPSVGCVVEKNGSIISSGFTSFNGRPHAEYIALNKKINFKNSNIYITLEPCSHHGVTPPCTDIIINKKIKNVYFSIKDVDLRSAGKSGVLFSRKKIFFEKGFFHKFAKNFYKDFFLKYKKKLPLIDAKIAISNDYFTVNKKNKWITNEHSRKRVHLLRSRYSGIVSSSRTINHDNSLLNCRINGLENKSPDIFIIDRNLNINKKSKIFLIKKRKVFIITYIKNKKKCNFFDKNVKFIFINKLNDKKDYYLLFSKINILGYNSLLIESGLTLFNYFYKNNLINNLYTFKSNINLKKEGTNYSNNYIIKRIKLEKKISVNLYNDKLYKTNLK